MNRNMPSFVQQAAAVPRSVQQAAAGSQWSISRIPEDIDLDLSTLTQEEWWFHMCIFLSRRIKSYGVLKLNKGALAETAEAFKIKYGGVRGIWNRYKKAIVKPEKYILDVSQKKGTGLVRKYTVAQLNRRVMAVQFCYCKTIRSLSCQTGIPRSTLHRHLSAGTLQKSRSAFEPILTDANKAARISYCGSFVDNDGCFKGMLD